MQELEELEILDVSSLNKDEVETSPTFDVVQALDDLRAEFTDKLNTFIAKQRVKDERTPIMWATVGPNGTFPRKNKTTDACFDVFSAEDRDVPPGKPTLLSTELYLEVPEGYEVQIRPRSGLAIKSGISVANTPGTVDATYSNEVKVGLCNWTDEVYQVKKGDRIAQIAYVKLSPMDLVTAPFDSTAEFQDHLKVKFGESSRGLDGFGSSGR